MKVLAIRSKRSVMAGGRRYQAGDEAALDQAISDKEKSHYASLGIIAVTKPKPKKESNAKVQRDD